MTKISAIEGGRSLYTPREMTQCERITINEILP